MAQTKIQQLNSQIFTVWSDEIEGRIDPSFYRPEFLDLLKQLKTKYVYKLGDLITNLSGGATPKVTKDFYLEKGGIPFLRVQNITEEGINLDDIKFIKREVHEGQLKRSQLKRDDIVFTITGRIGSVAVVPDNFEGNINQHSVRFHLRDKINGIKILSEYVAIFFNTDIGRNLSFRGVTGGTRPALDYDVLRNLKIPLPSIQIQNKIVDIMAKAYEEKRTKEKEAQKLLDSIDDYVLGELEIKMPEIKNEMCFEMWSDKIENKRLNIEYYQPKFKKLEKALKDGKYKMELLKNFITKIYYGVSTKNIYVDEGIHLLRILNIKKNYIDLSNVVKLPESKRKEIGNAFVKEEDLLISRSGTVGIVAVAPKEAEGFAFGSFMIKFCLNDKINKNFVSIWLNNKINKIFTEREKIGAIQGNITIGTIKNFNIPIPSLSIQNEIAEEAKSRREKTKKLQQEAKQLLQQAKQKVEELIEK